MTEQESGRFGIIPSRAIDDDRLGNAAFRVLSALSTYSDRDGWCWPSLAEVARRLNISRQAVSEQIKNLVDLAYVEAHEQQDGRGARGANRYRLMYDGDLPRVSDRARPPQGQLDTPVKHSLTPPQGELEGKDRRRTKTVLPNGSGTVAPLTNDTGTTGKETRAAARETDSRVRPVIDLFCRLHSERLRSPYPVVGGRDAQAIRRLPANFYTLEKLCTAVRRYFADAFNLRGRVDVPACMAKVPTLLAPRDASGAPATKPKAPSRVFTATPEERAALERAYAEKRERARGHEK